MKYNPIIPTTYPLNNCILNTGQGEEEKMHRLYRRVALMCAVLLAVSFSGFHTTSAIAMGSAEAAFVHAEGRMLVLRGEPYLIKGMAMGNDVWSNPTSAPVGDHDESSYQELSALGFNSVRFYLNYALFEDDANPYQYRQEGFNWLDQNIAWAKKHGIRLILNMHYPQGGYQSQGNGDSLWTDTENQMRLIALWTTIAERYADEETIIGYGLVNEPFPVGRTDARDGLLVWQELAQEITDSIRLVDSNHVIFVEKALGVKDPRTGIADWSLPDAEMFITIRDTNVVYEFHTYAPFNFTHQGFDWAGTRDIVSFYPNDDSYISGASWLSFNASDRAKTDSTGWQFLRSDPITIADRNANAVAFCFQAAGIGTDGIVYADDLYIEVLDENGETIRRIPCETEDYHGDFSFWTQNGEGEGSASDRTGFGDRHSLCIRGTTGDANLTLIRMEHTAGYQYRVSGYVKVESTAASAVIRLRLDAFDAQDIVTGSRNLLLQSVDSALSLSEQANCPVYCGEFGAGIHCFEQNRGGELWVAEYISILKEHNISFNYHLYYDGSFGLYYDLNGRRVRNDLLWQVFRDMIVD